MERSRYSSCDSSFLSDTLTLGLHRFDEVGCRRSFERQSVANLSNDAFLQGLNEVYAGVAARHFWSLKVELGQFTCPAERLAVRHNFGNHSPFICGTRRERLWVEQERLRSSRSGAITPRGKDSVTRHNAAGQVRHVMERRTLRRHNHV